MSAAGLETLEGAEAIRGFIEDWHRSWEDYRYEEEELLELGHGVVCARVERACAVAASLGHHASPCGP
jgi:hypothetical protein